MKTKLLLAAGAAMIFNLAGCSGNSTETTQDVVQDEPKKEIIIKYGMQVQDYDIKNA